MTGLQFAKPAEQTPALRIVDVGGDSPRPQRLTLTVIGPPKSGKTTFGANIIHTLNSEPGDKGGLLVDLEQGAYYVPNSVPAVMPESWEELKTLDRLSTLPNGRRITCVVIDTIDRAYDLLTQHALRKFNVTALNDAAYGAGWAYVREEMEAFLNTLRARFTLVVLLAHSRIGDTDATPRIDIPGKAGRFIVAWSDIVGFITARTEKDGNIVCTVAFGAGIGETGSRVAALQGKVLPADWKTIRTYLTKGSTA